MVIRDGSAGRCVRRGYQGRWGGIIRLIRLPFPKSNVESSGVFIESDDLYGQIEKNADRSDVRFVRDRQRACRAAV